LPGSKLRCFGGVSSSRADDYAFAVPFCVVRA